MRQGNTGPPVFLYIEAATAIQIEWLRVWDDESNMNLHASLAGKSSLSNPCRWESQKLEVFKWWRYPSSSLRIATVNSQSPTASQMLVEYGKGSAAWLILMKSSAIAWCWQINSKSRPLRLRSFYEWWGYSITTGEHQMCYKELIRATQSINVNRNSTSNLGMWH